ncbi:MAG: response regulator [Ignavibacteriaceae bacterium]|jgi:CheY-like chemotaxis protein|nr:response regulator [Ignavibacteriaceae bacterium]
MNEDKLKILLVEDSLENREVIAMFIRGIANVECASNGTEALTKTEENLFDIILMDINLGIGINGMEVTKQLRQTEKYKSTPIIAVTAYVMLDDQKKILDAGCSHYVSKPFSKKELNELILNVANDYRLSGKFQ